MIYQTCSSICKSILITIVFFELAICFRHTSITMKPIEIRPGQLRRPQVRGTWSDQSWCVSRRQPCNWLKKIMRIILPAPLITSQPLPWSRERVPTDLLINKPSLEVVKIVEELPFINRANSTQRYTSVFQLSLELQAGKLPTVRSVIPKHANRGQLRTKNLQPLSSFHYS